MFKVISEMKADLVNTLFWGNPCIITHEGEAVIPLNSILNLGNPSMLF
jgi:hypothetical protein